MKILKKILTIYFISSLIFNISLADSNNDCQIFGNLKYDQENKKPNGFDIVNIVREQDGERLDGITEKDSLNTAILNLKKYCCIKGLGGVNQNSKTCINDNKSFNPNILDSPYLFDHLLDINMRRLNGLTGENDIYKSMITNNSKGIDNKGIERRQRINSKAESITGANPQEIINKYKDFRSQSPLSHGYNINSNVHNVFIEKSNEEFLSYIRGTAGDEGSESKNIAKALKEYDKRSLYDRYNNTCALTEILYALLSQGGGYSNDVNEVRKLNYECYKIVSSQISSEIEYISLINKRSSNLFLSNYINGYISYLDKRSNTLKSTRKNSSDRFLDVVRAVPMLIPTCTKG